MSPEELKMSRMSAENILVDIGLTPDQVRKLTGNVPRFAPAPFRPPENKKEVQKTPAVAPLECDPKPSTRGEYVRAARKAVALHRKGEGMARACQRCGIGESLSGGIRHVMRRSPEALAVEAGKVPPAETPRHIVSFLRWYYDVTPPKFVVPPDLEPLRTALKAGGYSILQMSAETGVHHTSVQKFRNGSVRSMRDATRQKLWHFLKSQNLVK